MPVLFHFYLRVILNPLFVSESSFTTLQCTDILKICWPKRSQLTLQPRECLVLVFDYTKAVVPVTGVGAFDRITQDIIIIILLSRYQLSSRYI